MNDYDREAAANLARAAASYAIWQQDDKGAGEKILESAVAQGVIDGVHTRYMVTQRTGDDRLGRVAGVNAGLRLGALMLAIFVLPGVIFLGAVIISMNVDKDGDSKAWPIICSFVLVPALFLLMCYLGAKSRHTAERSAYTRAHLPSERELNKSGYWQVEPDVWHNPIVNRTLTGHAYNPREADQQRQAGRSESQQIRALYRDMKHNAPSTPSIPSTTPTSRPGFWQRSGLMD